MGFETIKGFIKTYNPEILMGIGMSGMIFSTVLAVKATPKAMILIDEKRCHIEEFDNRGLTRMDIIKCAWKCYIPTLAMTTISMGCLIGSSSMSNKRTAILATAYTLTDNAFHEYRQKVISTLGDKKDKEIKNDIVRDRIEKDPISDEEILITKYGETLCYDSVFGRYFKSDIERIKQIENDLNRKMRTELFISLNDFYYEIGLDPVKYGEDIGWTMDDGYIDIHYSSHLAKNGSPCLAIDYDLSPLTLI